MNRSMYMAFVAAAVALSPNPAVAQDSSASGYRLYIDGGATMEGESASTASLGGLIPSRLFPSVPRTAGPLALHWDLSVSHWRTQREHGGHHSFTQLTGMGVWRHPLGGPNAPLFVDVGVGVSVFDRLYTAGTERFSTALQFTQVLGVGYRFGPKQACEVSLRAQHISNAGIKKPNPGEEVLRVRFAYSF